MGYFDELSSDDVVFATMEYLARKNNHSHIIDYLKTVVELKDLGKTRFFYAVAQNGELNLLKNLMAIKPKTKTAGSKSQKEHIAAEKAQNENVKTQREHQYGKSRVLKGTRITTDLLESRPKSQKEFTIKKNDETAVKNQKEFKENAKSQQTKTQQEFAGKTGSGTNKNQIELKEVGEAHSSTSQTKSNETEKNQTETKKFEEEQTGKNQTELKETTNKQAALRNIHIVPTIIDNENLLKAAKDDDCQSIEKLLLKKVFIDTLDCWNMTPLMHAIFQGNENAAFLLIRKGANVHCSDNFGRCPIHLAAAYSTETIIMELIRKNANINEKDSAGKTALFYAKEEDNGKNYELLQKYGAHL